METVEIPQFWFRPLQYIGKDIDVSVVMWRQVPTTFRSDYGGRGRIPHMFHVKLLVPLALWTLFLRVCI